MRFKVRKVHLFYGLKTKDIYGIIRMKNKYLLSLLIDFYGALRKIKRHESISTTRNLKPVMGER